MRALFVSKLLYKRKVQQTFDNHWRGMQPWRDAKGNEIPGFIEGIAERQPFYKKLLQKYPNQPDSVLYFGHVSST